MPTKRTTHRSRGGKKLYAARIKKGTISDVQTYKRAHGQDVKAARESGTYSTLSRVLL
jgi:hypothetical protein